MKCQTRLCQVGPYGAKTRPALPNCHESFSAHLRYYTVYSGTSLPAFQDNLLVPSSRVTKSKRQNTARLKLTNTLFFFGTLFIVSFFKDALCFRSQLFPFSGKEAPYLTNLLDCAILNHLAPQKH